MQTILVTGGAGFIGGNFVHFLLRETSAFVVNLDALAYAGHRETLRPVWNHPRHVFVHGRIEDAGLMRELLHTYRPTAIVNFAAESHVDRSIDVPGAFVQTNIVGAYTLLETSRRYWATLPQPERDAFRYLHVSTDEVFGSLASSGAFHEDSPYHPNSPYAASKAAADHLTRAYQHTYGLPILVTNCSNNYGPYQYPEKLIPLALFRALQGKRIPVYGDGQQVRDWLHVEDHCRALLAVLQQGRVGETYCIGGSAEHTNLIVVQMLCAILDEMFDGCSHADQIEFVADRPGHDRRYAIDATKIGTELGWRPQLDFETGLRNTVAWYLANRAWCENVTRGFYQGERLGRVTL